MADEGTEAVEAVVFRDDQGELYAVPCALLEQLKVPEDQRDAMRRELEEAEDDDVSGFGMTGFNFTGYRTPIKIQPRPGYGNPMAGGNFWSGGRLIGDHGTGLR